MGFAADVSRITERAAKALDKTRQDVEIQLFTLIILRSAVDSGHFRGNWAISTGSPATGILDQYYPKGQEQAAIDAGVQVIEALRGGRVTFMTNNLPYAVKLEYGHSDQQPQGTVRRTAAQFQQVVDAAARRNKL